MGRLLAAAMLLTLAMGSTDKDTAGVWYWLSPVMVAFAVALIVDEAVARNRRP